MRIIKCDRCKEEHELDTAAVEGFRTLLSDEQFEYVRGTQYDSARI